MDPSTLKIEYTDMRDWPTFTRGGDLLQRKRVIAYIGKFGPFTEFFAVAEFSQAAVAARFEALRQTLVALPE